MSTSQRRHLPGTPRLRAASAFRTPSRALLALAALTVLAWSLAACTGASAPPRLASQAASASPVVEITLLQINDVYEITPVEGGRSGGLARVATLRQRLLEENPQTLTVLAGDFVSPSALGTAKVDGEPLAGKQMVAVLNSLGLDLATFGNHELDLREEPLLQRLAESRFPWITANVLRASGEPFPGVEPHRIYTFSTASGRQVRLGIFGVTITSTRTDYARYEDPLKAADEEVEELAESTDILVALTHLAVDQDIALAETHPEIDLILGGHEHENMSLLRGPDFTPIRKADANVRTVWVHRLRYDTESEELVVSSELVRIGPELPEEAETAAVVAHWVEAGLEGFRKEGFEPEEVVARSPGALDGREASVRNQETDLTDLLGDAMLAVSPDIEASLYNSGSIRIDDVLPPGPVTQYDVIRILPFGGAVIEVTVRGDLLAKALGEGDARRGTGGFLQRRGISGDEEKGWEVAGAPLDPQRTYRLAMNDYLAFGNESGLEFLSPNDPRLSVVERHADVRRVLIDELRRRWPASAGP